jgi:DNA polymerase-3 subunit gamma/tau
MRDAWPEILEVVQKAKRTAWMVVYTSTPRALNDDVFTLSFPSETDVSNFKERPTSGDSVSEQLRAAITTVLGIRVKFVARVDATAAPGAESAPAVETAAPAVAASTGWNVAVIPGSDGDGATPARDARASSGRTSSTARYGEAVVRELLGASFIEETNLAPRDLPVTLEPSGDPEPANPVGSAD